MGASDGTLLGSKRLRTLARHAKRQLKKAYYRVSDKDYPSTLGVSEPNRETLDFIATTDARCIAELGIYRGYTSEGFARFLDNRGELHLFDFEDTVNSVAARLRESGHRNVVVHPNSHKLLDSYNWSLMKMFEENRAPLFDYAFLDGAHTWNVDALTFFLVDRLLKVGGYIDFDDYDWSLALSPSLNPAVFPLTGKLYTEEQIAAKQVKLIVDLLVKRDERYEEVVENRIYKKIAE